MDPVAQPQRKMFYRTLPWHQVRSGDLPGEWRYGDGSAVPRDLWPSRERVMAGMVNKPWPPTPVAAPPPRTSAATAPPPRPAIVQPPVPYAPPAAVLNRQAILPRSQSTTSMPATTAAPAPNLGDVAQPRAMPNEIASRAAIQPFPTIVVRQPQTGVAPSPPSAFRPNTDARDAVASMLTSAPPQRATAMAAMPQAPLFNAGPRRARSRWVGPPAIDPPTAIDVPVRRRSGANDARDAVASLLAAPIAPRNVGVESVPPSPGAIDAGRYSRSPADSQVSDTINSMRFSLINNTRVAPLSPQQMRDLRQLQHESPIYHWAYSHADQEFQQALKKWNSGGRVGPMPSQAFRDLARELGQYPTDMLERSYSMVHGGTMRNAPTTRIYRQGDPQEAHFANPLFPRVNRSVRNLQHATGLEAIAPEIIDANELDANNRGTAGYYPDAKQVRLHPSRENNSATRLHEQYHASQYRDYPPLLLLQRRLRESGNQATRRTTAAPLNLAMELTPSIFGTAAKFHTGLIDTGQFPSPQDADEQLRGVLASNAGHVPDGYLAGPRGFSVPYSTIEQQAARYGAFGPTPRAKGLGYTGTTRRSLEELLTTPEGKAWLRRYMTAGVGE